MTDTIINPAHSVEVRTVRYPTNHTDFLVAVDGIPTGYFTLQLGGNDPETTAAFVLGQRILPGTEENFEDMVTRVIDGQLYTVNSVYQFNATEETLAAGPVNLEMYGNILLDIFVKKSGYQGPAEFITIMAAGKMEGKVTNVGPAVEIHYMVDGLVFAKAPHAGQ